MREIEKSLSLKNILIIQPLLPLPPLLLLLLDLLVLVDDLLLLPLLPLDPPPMNRNPPPDVELDDLGPPTATSPMILATNMMNTNAEETIDFNHIFTYKVNICNVPMIKKSTFLFPFFFLPCLPG